MSKAWIGGELPRPKIFDQWPKRPITFNSTISKERERNNKRKQSLRAQQLLQKSLMLQTNIKQFLSQKQKTITKYHKFQQQSLRLRKQLQELSTENKKQYKHQQYKGELEKYYYHIRDQTKFMRSSESFVLANLKNFNEKVTSVKLIRDNQSNQCHRQLQKKLAKIASDRSFLQSALVIYEQDQPPTQILPNFNLQKCIQNLHKQTSGQDLQQIHYLMLYQLNQLATENEEFSRSINKDRQNYKIYEAISDSMSLMENQTNQMKSDLQKMKSNYNNLKINNATEIIPLSHNSLSILSKNQKVYDANMELFARYNAETNLNQFSKRRKVYASQLDSWKKGFKKWKKADQIGFFLYNRHQAMNRYCKRLQLGDNNTNVKAERQQIKNAYYDCLNCEVPEQYKPFRNYRLDLVKNLGSTLQSSGILLPERKNLIKISESKIYKQQTKFHKYLNFFIDLEKTPDPSKVDYIFSKQNQIKALKYQLGAIGPKQPLTKQNYQIDFDYCQAIAEHAKTNNDKQYLNRISNNMSKRWISLPIGLDSLVFYYTMDVTLKEDCQFYIRDNFGKYMQRISSQVSSEIQEKGDQSNLDDPTRQYPYQFFNIPAQQRRTFFFNYYRKISHYSPNIKSNLFETYWNTASSYLISPYAQSVSKGYQKIQVAKKDFFTFRTLGYLTTESSRMKLSNYTQLIQYYIDYLSNYAPYKWGQSQLFLEIVKQRVFIDFLREKVRRQSLQTELRVMQKIQQACCLLYQSKDHLQLCDKNDLQTHLQHSIKIHKDWQENNLDINPKLNINLQQKCRKFLTEVRKSPLVAGTKVPLNDYQPIVNIPNNIKKLQKIKNIQSRLHFLCANYTRCHALLKVIDSFGNNPVFGSYDVLLVKDRNDNKLALDKVQDNAKRQLGACKPHLFKIISLYKGKSYEGDGYLSKSRTGEDAKFYEIISKLNSLKGKNDILIDSQIRS